jgi:hypothetical protein
VQAARLKGQAQWHSRLQQVRLPDNLAQMGRTKAFGQRYGIGNKGRPWRSGAKQIVTQEIVT